MSAEYGVTRPKLDARLEGSNVFTATANGWSDHYFTFSFDCDFNGCEMFSNGKLGDKIQLSTEYQAGQGLWLRYKKFGKSFNIFPSTLQKYVLFPTKPKAGTRVHFRYYNSNPVDSCEFGVNLFQFIPQKPVNPLLGEQGEDW